MGDTIHVTSRPMQLPVKQRNFGLPTEETGEASRRLGSRPTGSVSAEFGTVIPFVHSPQPVDGARLSSKARQAAGRTQRAAVDARG